MGIASFLTLVLIKGGLISQKNVRTVTLSWGGAYKPVNTVIGNTTSSEENVKI
jgi:hypothetical protein